MITKTLQNKFGRVTFSAPHIHEAETMDGGDVATWFLCMTGTVSSFFFGAINLGYWQPYQSAGRVLLFIFGISATIAAFITWIASFFY